MLSSIALPALALMSALSVGTPQDAQSILETVRAKQVERWEGVENYTVDMKMGGNRTLVYFEKFSIGDDASNPAFRMVPLTEISREQAEAMGFEPLTPEQLETFADAHEMLGDVMAQHGTTEGGMQPTGDPRELFGETAGFLRGAASYQENDGTADAARGITDMAVFARHARLVGKERVGDREAFLLRADNLAVVPEAQPSDEFTLETSSLWIDARDYVPLRLKMEGTMKTDEGDQPITIEKLDQDYRRVESLYEPFHQLLRISGLMGAMDPEDRKEMEEAMKEMEDLEEKLKELPESQRQMIMSRMGPQIEMMEKMAAGGAIEVPIEVSKIVVNQGPPGQIEMGKAAVGAP
jgi:hypothetical protein